MDSPGADNHNNDLTIPLMSQPQSKERLGTTILVIITWIMIMVIIAITKCGNDHPAFPPTPYPVPTDSITEQTDTIGSALDSIPKKKNKKKKKKSNKKQQKAAPPQPHNPLEHPVSGSKPS